MQTIPILFILSLLLSYILIIITSKVFYRFEILDSPEKYKLKRAPVPYGVWIIFYVTLVILSIIFIDINLKLFVILLLWWLVTGISFVDDNSWLSPKIRLFVQVLIWAIIAITSVKIGYIAPIFEWIIDIEIYSFFVYWKQLFIIPIVFTIVWYVLVFNALNWSDGVPWLTSWLSTVYFFVLFLLSVKLYYLDNYIWGIENALFVMKICTILIGALIIFWVFDVKQKLLIWDSGTMFLGFMLATLWIISWWKIATVAVVFWIYIFDAIFVISKRLLTGNNPFRGDFSHLHHRLLRCGLSEKRVLFINFSVALFLWILSLLLDRTWKIIAFWFLIILMFAVNFMINHKNITNKKKGWK